MRGRLPEHIEPLRLAMLGRALSGELALARMRRLGDLLASNEGSVAVELVFGTDEQRVRFVQGRVRGELRLVCQRCLEPMAFPLDIELALALVEHESEIDRIAGPYEPLLVGEGLMSLPAIVEDELILALPSVPVHAPGVPCESLVPAAADAHQHPFAALKATGGDDESR